MPDLPPAPRAPVPKKVPAAIASGVRATLLLPVLLAGLILLVSGGYGSLAVRLYRPAQPLGLSGTTQTQCVGRYRIDTPVELGRFSLINTQFAYGLEPYAPTIQLFIYPEGGSPPFAQAVAERLQWLQELRVGESNTSQLLAHEQWDTPHGPAHLLRHLAGPDATPYWPITSELQMQVAGRRVIAMGTSYAPAQADPPPVHVSYQAIDPAPMEARLRAIAQNIKTYSDAGTAPAGFCMDGLLMDNKTMGYAVERSLFGLSPPADGLGLRGLLLEMRGPVPAREEMLTQRVDREIAWLRQRHYELGTPQQIVALRRGTRSVDAMPGLEYVQARHSPDAVWFRMEWESQWHPAQQSLQRPGIDLMLRLGDYDGTAALDQASALALWDGLINSLRLSPANGG